MICNMYVCWIQVCCMSYSGLLLPYVSTYLRAYITAKTVKQVEVETVKTDRRRMTNDLARP